MSSNQTLSYEEIHSLSLEDCRTLIHNLHVTISKWHGGKWFDNVVDNAGFGTGYGATACLRQVEQDLFKVLTPFKSNCGVNDDV